MLEETAKDQNIKIQTCAMLFNEKYQINDIEPLTLMEYIINLNNDKNENIKFYLYIFVIISAKNNNINKKLRKESIIFVLSNYDNIIKEQNNEDVSSLTKSIIDLINYDYMYSNYELDLIYENIKSIFFDEVSFFILNKIKKYHKCIELLVKPKSSINNRTKRLFDWILNTHKSLSFDGKGMKEFKKDIKNNLTGIANIDLIKFDEMVKVIFEGERKMVLETILSKSKQLCLNYIELLLNKFSKILYRDEEIDFNNHEFVSYFLILHIKLLCEFKKFDEVVKAIENKDVIYPFNETLKLCSENKIYDAVIHLYKINCEFTNGVELCLERLDNNFQNFISDIKNNKVSNNIDIDDNYLKINTKYLNKGIQICEYNSESIEDEIWFKLLNKLYEFDDKLKQERELYKNNDLKKNKNFIEYFNNQINQDIKDIMEKISSYVGIGRILNLLSERNKNASFKDIKELIMKIIFNYGRQTKIFESTKKLLTNLILQNETYFQIMNQEGSLLDLEKCDKCKKNFNDKLNKETILIFKCQHLYHSNCARKERTETGYELICPVCRELEIEQSINTKKTLIRRKATKLLDLFPSKRENQNNMSVNKQNLIKKLKKFDDKLKAKKRISIQSNLKENY